MGAEKGGLAFQYRFSFWFSSFVLIPSPFLSAGKKEPAPSPAQTVEE